MFHRHLRKNSLTLTKKKCFREEIAFGSSIELNYGPLRKLQCFSIWWPVHSCSVPSLLRAQTWVSVASERGAGADMLSCVRLYAFALPQWLLWESVYHPMAPFSSAAACFLGSSKVMKTGASDHQLTVSTWWALLHSIEIGRWAYLDAQQPSARKFIK